MFESLRPDHKIKEIRIETAAKCGRFHFRVRVRVRSKQALDLAPRGRKVVPVVVPLHRVVP